MTDILDLSGWEVLSSDVIDDEYIIEASYPSKLIASVCHKRLHTAGLASQ